MSEQVATTPAKATPPKAATGEKRKAHDYTGESLDDMLRIYYGTPTAHQ